MSEFLSDRAFQELRDYVSNQSGMQFTEDNRFLLEKRLKERLRETGNRLPTNYLRVLLHSAEETRLFLDSLTTNFTRFFRNQAHCHTLDKYVLPNLVKHKEHSEKKIRIWSAGCSTGEEPYTNAIVLREELPSDWKIEVIASDLSLESLKIAKEGFYPQKISRDIPENILLRYFIAEKRGYRIKDEIRDTVTFDYHNLLFDSSLMNIDIVFCRNVLIYFDKKSQEQVLNHFWNAMNAHSFLFIGHSETLLDGEYPFEFIKTDWACIYGRKTSPAFVPL